MHRRDSLKLIASKRPLLKENLPDRLWKKIYLNEDIKSHLKLSIYDDIVKPPGEWDFLLIVSHLKMLINIEVKTQIDMKGREKQNLNDSLKSASHQCKEHAEYAADVFSPFLLFVHESWDKYDTFLLSRQQSRRHITRL